MLRQAVSGECDDDLLAATLGFREKFLGEAD
jgi:hypothetical protein